MPNPTYGGGQLNRPSGPISISQSFRSRFGVSYWREGNKEVDFVLNIRGKTIALKVKSNGEKRSAGLLLFQEKFRQNRCLVVGRATCPSKASFNLTGSHWSIEKFSRISIRFTHRLFAFGYNTSQQQISRGLK